MPITIVDAQVHLWGANTAERPWPQGHSQPQCERVFAHIDELCRFARYANVAVKVTSLPTYSNEAYPHPKLHPYVRRMYDAFGPKRLFWGSDLTRMPCSYRLCKTMFTEELRWLTGDDLEWIMGRGVCEWLGWPLPSLA